jgi:hypothetical protein
MSARDVIGAAIESNCDETFTVKDFDQMKDDVIAAIRAMSVEDQAELIGGDVWEGFEPTRFAGPVSRVRGPWRHVTQDDN